MATPPLAIVVSAGSGPLHIVTSGQIISGKVTFANKQDHPAGIVTVSLVGKTKTTFNKGRSVYYGSATLFNLSETLHDGTLPPKDYEWPFEFTFPEVTAGEKKKWLDTPPYQVAEGHALPPSMMFDSKDFERDSGKGAIVYMLEAKFSKSSKSSIFSSAERAEVALYYIPYRKLETPAPKVGLVGKESITCSSKLLGPAGEKPKGLFKRLKVPCSVFEVAITAPQTIYVGAPIPITLLLTHDLQKSTAPQAPTVKLTSCVVSLIRTMHAAGKAVFEDDGQFSIMEILLKKEKLDIPLSESQNLSELLSLPNFETKHGMSFSTYNIAQTFKFMVKLTLECADKTFWTELRSRNILILSPFTKDLVEKGGGNPTSLLLKMNNIREDDEINGAGMLIDILGIGVASLSFFL